MIYETGIQFAIPNLDKINIKQKAYEIAGAPDPLPFDDRVVAIMEARDGTVLDVVREIKPIA